MSQGRRNLLLFSALALLPAALLALHSNKFFLPTAQWDGTALDAVLALREGSFRSAPYLIHPPLYLHLLAFFKPLFGADLLAGARFLNAACYLLTGWLVVLLAGSLAEARGKTAAGVTAALLYFTSPLALQGVFLLDLGDTSLVPLAAGLYFLYGCAPGARWYAAAPLFALNLWSKFIHSLFIAAAAGAAWAWDRRDSRGALAVLAGTGLFLATWAAYGFASLDPGSRWLPVWYFFNEMLFGYQSRSLAGGLTDALLGRANSISRILLWTWPLLLAWGARLYDKGFGSGRERHVNLFLVIFLIISALSKGTSNGFPKYHAAALPPLCALGGAWLAGLLSETRFTRAPVLLLAVGVAAWALIALGGDPLYTLNYSVRAALIGGAGLASAALLLLLQVFAAAGAAVMIYFTARRGLEKAPSAALAVLGVALIWSTAVGFRQARADYFTTYGYGTRGKAEAVAWLAANRGGAVLGPNEFDWEMKAAGLPFRKVSDLCTADKACLLKILKDPETGFFVFGPASNTVGQIKDFLSLSERDLGRGFIPLKIGDFWIYTLGGGRP